MSLKSLASTTISCSLALTLGIGTGVAVASELPSPETPEVQTATQPQQEVTAEEFVQGLNELVEQGKLKLISSEESPAGVAKSYGIVDPASGEVFMTFATNIPKYQDRLGGALWGWEPAITFNQTDQQVIATGGTQAVTAMAAAAAAALSETVVGGILSAGVIAFVGNAATIYMEKYGHCPASRPTLWVGTMTRRAACR